MKPTIGRIVHYRLSEQDANLISKRRDDSFVEGQARNHGNAARAGDVYPAMVVRVFDPSTTTANLQVFLDGNDTYWATSRQEAPDDMSEGYWFWPPRA
jgi:hypothetical protein